MVKQGRLRQAGQVEAVLAFLTGLAFQLADLLVTTLPDFPYLPKFPGAPLVD